MPDKIQILSPEQIKDFKQNGHKLDSSKYYTITGMYNNKWNEAADPGRFKIATSAMDKIAKTSIGRPWIPFGNKINKHVRPHPLATVNEILEFQKKFAGGEIVSYIYNQQSNIVYAIIEIWPDFIKMVEDEEIYPFTSVMIGNQVFNKEGEYIDGEVLHIHSVETPGYSPTFAKFKAFCTGGIKQCMEELRPMAASGTLLKFREQQTKIDFSKILNHLNNIPHAARGPFTKLIDHDLIMAALVDQFFPGRISTKRNTNDPLSLDHQLILQHIGIPFSAASKMKQTY